MKEKPSRVKGRKHTTRGGKIIIIIITTIIYCASDNWVIIITELWPVLHIFCCWVFV